MQLIAYLFFPHMFVFGTTQINKKGKKINIIDYMKSDEYFSERFNSNLNAKEVKKIIFFLTCKTKNIDNTNNKKLTI